MSGRYALVSRMRNGAIVSWALAWVLACAFAMGVLWYELGESFDSKLQETAQLLLSIAARAPGGLSATDGGELRARTGMRDHEEYVVYQIFDREGRLVLASHEAPDQPLAPLRPGFKSTPRWRIYTEVEPAARTVGAGGRSAQPSPGGSAPRDDHADAAAGAGDAAGGMADRPVAGPCHATAGRDGSGLGAARQRRPVAPALR
jgi:predicted outer membrane lipoprotein